MYEEEDDGLPMSYRRLTAHLQTGSADFNRRLAAYLANQVAMRSAVDQMVHNQYLQAFPNAPQYAHNNPPQFENPFTAEFLSSQQPAQQQSSQSPQQTTHQPKPQQMRSPQSAPSTNFRSAPYPNPHALKNHGRSQSIAGATATRPIMASPEIDRRMSMPVPQEATIKDEVKTESQSPQQTRNILPMSPSSFIPDTGPLTTTLPEETQMFLGPGFGLDPNDSFTSALMGGNDKPWVAFNYGMSDSNPSKNHPSYNGLSATLAPSVLDKSTAAMNPPEMAFDMPAWNFRLDPTAGKIKGTGSDTGSDTVPRQMQTTDGLLTDGQITPGENLWESFLEQGSWDEPSLSLGSG